MPDIDPTSLHQPETIQTSLNPSALSLNKPNAISTTAPAPKAPKTVTASGPQRVDIEPLYTSLKTAIGENWLEYKKAIGKFVIGQLKQSELEQRIDHFITASSEVEHLHNSLITAVYANAHREPPEPGVAPWVAANDKPVSGTGGSGVGKGGDKVEERLRKEIMALPGKDRRRLKEVIEHDRYDPYSGQVNDYRLARSIKLPDSIPASAGGLNKTNWDLEIRKRYTHPLFHETLEFPDVATIATRMLPICYEESLPNGHADQCAEFVATAAEMFIKDVVGSIVSLTRNTSINVSPKNSLDLRNGKIHSANNKSLRDGIQAGREAPLGPTPLGISDLRIALSTTSCSLGSMPNTITDILGGWPEGVLEGWETQHRPTSNDQILDLEMTNGLSNSISLTSSTDEQQRKMMVVDNVGGKSGGLLTNGLPNGIGSSTHHVGLRAGVGDSFGGGGLAMVNGSAKVEESGIPEWEGSSSRDRHELFGLLDQCLALGQ